ncbi:MAG: tetratricopeptide repeat protein, partial [Acidobacteriota bacterium]|nr:tetratricopeptide repeat protein [Acidobacteriota bacterium]
MRTRPDATFPGRFRDLYISLGLAALVLAIYAPTAYYGFVNFDDDVYVYQNPAVMHGFTVAGLKWAITTFDFYYWQPVTWISHMLDCQLFGLRPGWHHLINTILHASNTILLFFLLRDATGRIWRSALVAALFAIHPLRVESVAWIAERKDVLSGFFWILTLWAYLRYARAPFSLIRYAGVIALFALGLMSKPSLMTLPLILLLWDYWPMGRRRPFLEKAPLFGLSIAGGAIAFYGASRTAAISSLPLSERTAHAVSAYAGYLVKTFWPARLSVMYPYRTDLPLVEIVVSVMLLGAITVFVLFWGQRLPYLRTGWFWFAIVLAPACGLVQVGPQAMADRFTYIPSIGLFLMLVWLSADQVEAWRIKPVFAYASAGFALTALTCVSISQVHTWQSGVTLFTRAVELSPEDPLVQHNLGYALASQGRGGEAVPHYREALRRDPNFFRAHYNLGRALAEGGELAEAASHLERVLELNSQPEYVADAHNALGVVRVRQGNFAEATRHFREAARLKPSSPEIHGNLGSLLAREGKLEEAAAQFSESVRLNPGYIEGHRNLG